MNHTASPRKLPPIRNRYFFIADVLLMPLAVVLSFLLRLDPSGLQPYTRTIFVLGTLAALVKPGVYYLFGLYRRYWRYGSANDLVIITTAVTSASLLVGLLVYLVLPLLITYPPVPRSIPIIDWLLCLAMVGGTRLSLRIIAENRLLETPGGVRSRRASPARRVLVMGAGNAGALIVREMRNNPGLGIIPVGLLDDNRAKVGVTIHGVPVLGTRQDIPRLVQGGQIDEVIIAMPAAAGQAIRAVVNICQETGVACKTMPSVHELIIAGQVSVKQAREVRIEDLLRRQPVETGVAEAGRYLSDSVVLVTGAGGSIGSELCRQIARHRPTRMLLLGHGENSIYHISLELQEKFPHLSVQPLIADIRDINRLAEIIERFHPETIFHAAAHKHVPLMEACVAEAVANNVFGTQTLLQAAEANEVEHFVLVSTDKAVNPVNVMGATKRMAEILVQDTARRTGRAYAVVRFGNVLGSRGSVIPLFQRQIAAGGPVTVTHPEVTRYFMTIPEAVQLIIQAAALGHGGEIFVLDMGESVRIADLATELIRLSDLGPESDIKLVFTGLRPGEKLNEELFSRDEKPYPTQHEKIIVAHGNNTWDSAALSRHMQKLRILTAEGDAARICAKLQEIIPEYTPQPATVDPTTGFRTQMHADSIDFQCRSA